MAKIISQEKTGEISTRVDPLPVTLFRGSILFTGVFGVLVKESNNRNFVLARNINNYF